MYSELTPHLRLSILYGYVGKVAQRNLNNKINNRDIRTVLAWFVNGESEVLY